MVVVPCTRGNCRVRHTGRKDSSRFIRCAASIAAAVATEAAAGTFALQEEQHHSGGKHEERDDDWRGLSTRREPGRRTATSTAPAAQNGSSTAVTRSRVLKPARARRTVSVEGGRSVSVKVDAPKRTAGAPCVWEKSPADATKAT